jgi:hypothetical protein
MIRQNLLRKFRRFITLPHQVPDGRTITELLDMEIGHVEHHWHQVAGIPSSIRRLVTVARKVRNSLAHLEPVNPSLLTKSVLEQGLELLQN